MKPACVLLALLVGSARADELPTLAGPAMGTTYRVTLAADIPGLRRGEVHREIERVLGRIDRAASTWREDSDASRFNRAAAGEWVDVSGDLVAIVQIARAVHVESDGAFDLTVAAAESGRPVGMRHVAVRPAPPALQKAVAGIAIDLGGIGPGYAVDCIGARLEELGSVGHLVELGGEVRAWGTRPGGAAWQVRLRTDGGPSRVVALAPGEALATSSARPGRSPIDPRTGRVATTASGTLTVRAGSCARADALAVAGLVSGVAADATGIVTAEPSTPAAPTAATPAAP